MNCDNCTLKGNCQVFGEGPQDAKLIIVGEAPGVTEVKEGKPFVGAAGQVLNSVLERVGIKREECYITNAVICHPFSNQTPTLKEIKCCRERLKKSILQRNPKLIIAMGNAAYCSLLNKSHVSGVMEKRGLFFQSDEFGCKILVTIHPAAILRDRTLYSIFIEDMLRGARYFKADITALQSKREYVALETVVEVQTLLKELKERQVFAFDIETTGLNPWEDQVLSYAFCFQEKKAYCIFTDVRDNTWEKDEWQVLESEIKQVLESSKLIIQNALFELPFLKVSKGWNLRCYFDTMLAHHLLDENAKGQHGLKKLATRFPDLIDYAHEVDITQLRYLDNVRFVNYTCSDVDATWRLYNMFSKQLEEEGLTWLFNNITMPLTYVLTNMHVYGIKVDVDLLLQLKTAYESELNELINWVKDTYGDYNLASPMQLSELLYVKLGLPMIDKTTAGKPSTNDKTLKKLLEQVTSEQEKELLQKVLRFRKVLKLYKTYVVGIAKRVNRKTGRLHTEFLIHGTKTGRLSSINPNLQNTAGEKEIKNLFIAEKGWKLIEADYKQLEFRIFMNYVKDEKAFEDLRRGFDVHRVVAARVLNKSYEQVTDEERTTAKGVVFGLLYGMSTETLAEVYNLPFNKAEEFVRSFWRMYPKAKKWWIDLRESLRKKGFVVNLYGRKRRLPEIFSNNTTVVATALRRGINAPVQGGAVDVANYALIQIYQYLIKNKYQAHPLLQIHDSIILEAPDEEVEEVVKIVRQLMTQNIPGIKVPLEVDINVVERWGEENTV